MKMSLNFLYCGMKGKRYSFITLLLLTACTKRPDNTAITHIVESKAQKYLAKTLPDPKSYKPIAFSPLDSIMLSHLNDKNYIRLDDSIMEVEAVRFREMGENWTLFEQRKASGYYEKKQALFKKQQALIARRVKPRFAGYKLEHEFKAVDTSGDTVINKYVFCFDPKGNITKVLK
jgi:hypothetical protein